MLWLAYTVWALASPDTAVAVGVGFVLLALVREAVWKPHHNGPR